MPLEEISFGAFGRGLNLRDKPDVVSEEEAIDLRNVALTERGAVVQRSGYDALTSPALTNRARTLEPFYTTSGTKQLVAGCGTRLEATNTSGGVVASLTALTDGTWDFARFGAPGSEYVYAGQGNQTLRRWDGSAWSAIGSTPQGGALAVMSVEQGNRLVVGRFNTTTGGPTGGAATSNPSRVYFSDAGAPETWTADNYVDFWPGDGEKVQAIVSWRELVFVFKESRFFVIHGAQEDVSGGPIFQWRAIDAGAGTVGPRGAVAGVDGVYFVNRHGVYRTTGSDPELISDAVSTFFDGGSSPFYTGGELSHAQTANLALGYHDERLYVGATTAGSENDRTLVYDPAHGWWSLWDIPATCFASFRISNQAELVFGYAAGSNHIGRHSPAFTNDDGAAITSFWRGGWVDLGVPAIKVLKETQLWGTGTVKVGISTDYNSSPYYIGNTLLATLEFGEDTYFWESGVWEAGFWAGAGSLTTRVSRVAARGTVFSSYLFNNTLDTTWAVHRFIAHMLPTRAVGTVLP